MVDDALARALLRWTRLFGLVLCCFVIWGLASPASQALANGAPIIGSVSVSGVTAHDATLEAQIDPNGPETTYKFHLISPACQSEWPAVGPCMAITVWSLPATVIPAGGDTQTVSLDLNGADVGLRPGTWYEYGMTASNAEGEASPAEEGGEHSFKTLSASEEAPVVESESVSNVTEHDATLEAQINANGGYTGYEFQIDTNGSYDFTRPNCPFDLPGYAQCESISVGEPLPAGLVEPQPEYIPGESSGDQAVSLDLASIGATLQPDTTYHYRVVASSGGTREVVGPDQSFQTPSTQSLPTAPPVGEEKPPRNNDGDPSGISLPGASSSVSSDTSTASASSATFGASLLASRVQEVRPSAPADSRKLATALERCKKKPKRRRAACKRRAMKKYAATAKYVSKKASERSRARHR